MSRRRYSTIVALLVTAVFLTPTQLVRACDVCFGKADSQMIDAARMSVWLLIGVTAAVQVAFATFFIYLWRRSRLAARLKSVDSGWADSGKELS